MQRQKFLLFSLVLMHLFLAGIILYLRPFWGLMDDGHNLNRMNEIAQYGFATRFWIELKGDISWGMLRLFILPMYYLIYKPFQDSSTTTFLWNFILTSLTIFTLCFAFARSGLQKTLEKVFDLKWEKREILVLLWVLTLCFPWFYYLLSSPSLQEKLVFLGLALVILGLRSQKLDTAKIFYPAALVLLSIGFVTKSQFIFLIPTVLGLQAYTDWERKAHINWSRLAYLALISLIWVVILMRISSQGSYTSGNFSLTKIPQNLMESRSFWLISLINLGAVYLLFQRFRAVGISSWHHFLPILCPIISMQGFMTAMLGWRLGGYLNSFMSPFFAIAALVYFASFSRMRLSLRALQLALVLVMTAVGSYKAWTHFTFLGSIRTIVEHPEIARIIGEGNQVFVSGLEGADHLRAYIRNFGKVPSAEVFYADTNSPHHINIYLQKGLPKYLYWIDSPVWMPISLPTSLGLDPAKIEIIVDHDSEHGMRLVRIQIEPQVVESN